MQKNLVRLSKVKSGSLPVEKSTLYKWRHIQKFPELFIKFGGAVFVDLDMLAQLLESGRGA
jgi:hypothetical protein